MCSEAPDIDEALFQLYKKMKIEDPKRKLSNTTNHKFAKKMRLNKKAAPSPGFTRFSVKYFSDVLSALTNHQKFVIENYGFGCLLKFDKCAVPKRFAMWIARQVDVRSCDIVQNGKIISFTKEAMNWVLDLPIGGKEIVSDSRSGHKFLLSIFGKAAMPQTSFFGNMLKDKDLSDEKIFICFMIVALSSFLCPNSNIHPSSKYFVVFENLGDVKKYDWSKYVLEWLMEMIAKFTVGNKCTGKRSKSLGGCVYLLAVLYLDHVDFGQHQVSRGIPHIDVWKGDMMKSYSQLDVVDDFVYGKRPLKDISCTCYNQVASSKITCTTSHTASVGTRVFDFRKTLELDFGELFPLEVRESIWNLVQSHHEDPSQNGDLKAEVLVLDVLRYLNESSSRVFPNDVIIGTEPKIDVGNKIPDISSTDLYADVFDNVPKDNPEVDVNVDIVDHPKQLDTSNDDNEVQILYVTESRKKCHSKSEDSSSLELGTSHQVSKNNTVPQNSNDDKSMGSNMHNTDAEVVLKKLSKDGHESKLMKAFDEVANDSSNHKTQLIDEKSPTSSMRSEDAVPFCTQQNTICLDKLEETDGIKSNHAVNVVKKDSPEVQIVSEVKFSKKCTKYLKALMQFTIT